MNWPDLSMGGYGFYVWGSYLFSLILIVWEVVSLETAQKSAAAATAAATTQVEFCVSFSFNREC